MVLILGKDLVIWSSSERGGLKLREGDLETVLVRLEGYIATRASILLFILCAHAPCHVTLQMLLLTRSCPFPRPLNLNWCCDLFWPAECRGSEHLPLLSFGPQRPTCSHLLFQTLPLPWEHAWAGVMEDERLVGQSSAAPFVTAQVGSDLLRVSSHLHP